MMLKNCDAPMVPVHQHEVGPCACGRRGWLYSFCVAGAPDCDGSCKGAKKRVCGECAIDAVRDARDFRSDERRCA